MNSKTKQQEILKSKLHYLRWVLLFLLLVLVACSDRVIAYKGTCAEQTQQFLAYIHSVVVDELTPVIEEGLSSAPPADVTTRMEELDARVSKINTPECNTRTQAVKDTLRLYMLESKNYFSVVAGRSVYGEGQVQAQLSKVYEAFDTFEIAFDDLRR